MSNKTITIHQGTGDDALEMTVQVNQEELDKMEEIRSKDPSSWEGRGLDLVKAAREARIKSTINDEVYTRKKNKQKLFLGLVLGLITIVCVVGIVVFAVNKNNKQRLAILSSDSEPGISVQQWIDKECVEVNRRWLFDALMAKKSSMVSRSFETFNYSMDNSYYRKQVYEDAQRLQIIVGTFDEYEYAMTQPAPDITRRLFEIASYYGMPDQYEDLASYLSLNEENRKQFYDKLIPFGMPENSFDEFSAIVSCLQNNQIQSFEENMRNIYDKLATLGSEGSYEQFLEFFNANDENKRLVYDNLAANGSIGSYEQFLEYAGYTTNTPSVSTHQRRRMLYDDLTAYGCDLGDFELFSQKLNNKTQRRIFYDSISEYFNIGSWEEFTSAIGNNATKTDYTSATIQRKFFSSEQYGFTYQYDDKEFNLVDRINKNSHCVMKLQSPKDEIKSVLISVWENSDFSSAYDPDFIESCQSVDQEMGVVIKNATKAKVDGVNALKSELKISPMGKSYYTAIYRIIHKKRMYMLNIYIPIDEYNKDKSYADRCASNFKFK